MKGLIIKRVVVASILLAILNSCATQKPEIQTVTKIERVVIQPPAELLEIPPYDFPADVETATQRTVAEWMLKTEKRSNQMEDQLKAIKKFFKDIK